MKTTYTIFHPNGTIGHGEVDWPEAPGYPAIAYSLKPVVDGELEHVTVLHDGKRADMFVNDVGLLNGLPRNEAATKIYRNNWLTQHPNDDPEELPFIAGVAVLFDRIIWT